MKNWYQMSKQEVLDTLGVTSDGLSSDKARELLEKNGKNVLDEGKKKSVLQVFLSQFVDFLVQLSDSRFACVRFYNLFQRTL